MDKFDKVIFKDLDTGENVEVKIQISQEKPYYDFIVTHNTWEEVESLGVTRHHEDPNIYFEYIKAHNHNHAKFIYSTYNDIDYIKVRARKIKKSWIKNF